MVCKITSTKSNTLSQRGFTIVEFMVAVAIGSLVLLAIAVLISYSSRSFAAVANYVDLDQTSRQALDVMTREIRATRRLISMSSNALSFEDNDGATLTYTYDSNARTLTRSKNGTNTVLLTECDTLNFSIYQRNPINGSYDQYPAATAATCKLVNIHWVCTRKIMGNIANSESVQTAKVVIREQ